MDQKRRRHSAPGNMLETTLVLVSLLLFGASPSTGQTRAVFGDADGLLGISVEAPTPNLSLLYFLTHECPISNQYAPEIQRIAADYVDRAVQCFLVYVDPDLTRTEVEKHLKDYSHRSCTPILDRDHRLVERVGATITPEAALLSGTGELLYRGRINNFYAGLGRPRRQVTQPDLRNAIDAVLAGKRIDQPRTQAIGCFIPTTGP